MGRMNIVRFSRCRLCDQLGVDLSPGRCVKAVQSKAHQQVSSVHATEVSQTKDGLQLVGETTMRSARAVTVMTLAIGIWTNPVQPQPLPQFDETPITPGFWAFPSKKLHTIHEIAETCSAALRSDLAMAILSD
jgi:hypothetical protein